MIKNLVLRKLLFINEQSQKNKIILIYRYLSLIITSFFYFLNNQNHSLTKKAFIIGCIFVASVILSYLYIKNQKSVSKIKILILIETIGNSLILIPSGGLNSPYIWNSLNTIIISAFELRKEYCFVNLFIYIFVSKFLVRIYENNHTLHVKQSEELNIILSLVLITSIIQLLSMYIARIQNESNKLEEANKKLILANKKIKDSIDQIMEMYRVVHFFTEHEDKESLIELIVKYTKETTKVKSAIFWNIERDKKKMVIEGEETPLNLKDTLDDELSKINSFSKSEAPICINMDNREYIFYSIKSNQKMYGALGIEIACTKDDEIYKESTEQIKFLSELSSLAFERASSEDAYNRLIISEEQNRIANEIHDSVLQRLFSISCGIYGLNKNIYNLSADEIKDELNRMRRSLDSSMKELRNTIYRLSWSKDGIDAFEVDIKKYINDIKVLTNMNISFNIFGNHELLSSIQKKAFYRIICEGIGNAVRHGEATNIEINLNILEDNCLLEIIDDGKGFDLNKKKSDKQMGLGIKNIYYLIHSLNGSIEVKSAIGCGTAIKAFIPNYKNVGKGENVV